jgi:hypothetical protein
LFTPINNSVLFCSTYWDQFAEKISNFQQLNFINNQLKNNKWRNCFYASLVKKNCLISKCSLHLPLVEWAGYGGDGGRMTWGRGDGDGGIWGEGNGDDGRWWCSGCGII